MSALNKTFPSFLCLAVKIIWFNVVSETRSEWVGDVRFLITYVLTILENANLMR